MRVTCGMKSECLFQTRCGVSNVSGLAMEPRHAVKIRDACCAVKRLMMDLHVPPLKNASTVETLNT